MRRFMLVLKIVFYIGRRMPILKLVRNVTVQDGKVMSLKVNKLLMLPPRKKREETCKDPTVVSLKAKIATIIYVS